MTPLPAVLALWSALGCRPPTSAPAPRPAPEPLGTAAHRAAAAAAAERVPDPARGGPPVSPAASPLPPFTGVDRGSARYVGSETCAPCHTAAYQAWRASNHSHAVRTLETADRAHDPRCLRCHVTGLGHPSGFSDDPTPPLGAVGCEGCHGPGSAHVAGPGTGYGALPRDASACVACHTHDNSPDFRWAPYWAAVVHGPSGR